MTMASLYRDNIAAVQVNIQMIFCSQWKCGVECNYFIIMLL